MASIGTLYTIPTQGAGIRIRAVAVLNGFKLDLPENYVHHQDNLKPEFLAKFPHGKIPAFEGADGFRLFEAAAIARYVAALNPETTLLGRDLKEAALVDQWVSFADSEIAANTTLIYQIVKGAFGPYSKSMHDTIIERQRRSLTTLEGYLAARAPAHAFLVNDGVTLADLTVACAVQRACVVDLHAALRAQFPNVMRHSEAIVNIPELAEVFSGKNKYREEPLGYEPVAQKA